MRIIICSLLLNVLSFTPLLAQGVVTPSSHWGTILIPERTEREEWGFHAVGFTQYGKELIPGTEQYTFRPYNDMDETLGFNFITLSCTDHIQPFSNPLVACPELATRVLGPLLRTKSFEPGAGDGIHNSVSENPLSRRRTFLLGLVDDHATEFLQNRVVHLANWRDEKLVRIPRSVDDTPDETSLGPTKALPLLGVSDEYFLRLGFTRKEGTEPDQLEDVRVLSPFFLGGGFALSTINQEAFLHVGADITKASLGIRPLGWLGVDGIELRSVGAGAMMRGGILAPGPHLDDLTGQYLTTQGVVRLVVDWWAYPTVLDLGITSAQGFFVAPRTPAQWAEIHERDARPEDVYDAKSPMNERFVSLRVRIGDFTFETYNDMLGGKDKGPSFGAHMTINFHTPQRFNPRSHIAEDLVVTEEVRP